MRSRRFESEAGAHLTIASVPTLLRVASITCCSKSFAVASCLTGLLAGAVGTTLPVRVVVASGTGVSRVAAVMRAPTACRAGERTAWYEGMNAEVLAAQAQRTVENRRGMMG